MNNFYRVTEKDFIDGEIEFCEKLLVYNGYRIEISYDDETWRWECDAFDLEAEQYVFYPCLKVKDKNKTRFDEVAQRCAELIEEKIKEKERYPESDDILIYVNNDI